MAKYYKDKAAAEKAKAPTTTKPGATTAPPH